MSQVAPQNAPYLAYLSQKFIGRRDKIALFVEKILNPASSVSSILAISGNGGVGKTTLLNQYTTLAKSPIFSDNCLMVYVDEHQLTPVEVMKEFANQFSKSGYRLKKFEQEWYRYKDITQQQQAKREDDQKEAASAAAKMFGMAIDAAANIVAPGAGNILGSMPEEGAQFAFSFLTKKFEEQQHKAEAELVNAPLNELTLAFANDLLTISRPRSFLIHQQVKPRRLLLVFDTFGHLAPFVAPWLLDYLLPNVSENVGLIIAGRAPIEVSTPDGLRRWQKYYDNNSLYSTSLENFSNEETRLYLQAQGITDPKKVESIWQTTNGSPYYLYLLTAYGSKGDTDPRASVVENLLSRIPTDDVKRKLVLEAALLANSFNQDDLAALPLLTGQDAASMYDWLIDQPFIQKQDKPHYDEHIQALLCLYLKQRSPNDYNNVRKALVEHYQKQLQERIGQEAYSSEEWLTLVLALVTELLLIQSSDSVYRCQAIGLVIRAYVNVHNPRGVRVITKTLQDLSQDRPNNPADENARTIAQKLLVCLRADLGSQDFIEANSYLLGQAANEPSFPKEVLAAIYRMRGQAYTALHQYTQARKDFDQSINLNPNDAIEYGSRGFACRLAGDYQQAVQDFNQALTINPNYTWVYAQRALTYRHLGQFEQAIADFNSAIHFYPKSSWTYGQRGKTHRLLKNYLQAIKDFNQAITIDPKDAWAYAQLGLAHLWMQDLAQAKQDYQTSQKLYTKDISYSWLSIWIDMCIQKDNAKAIQQLEALNTTDQPRYIALVCQGIASWFSNNFEQAKSQLEQAITLEPERWDVHFWQGMTYASLGQDEEATKEVKHALTSGMPPVLLAPLNWFGQGKAALYQK